MKDNRIKKAVKEVYSKIAKQDNSCACAGSAGHRHLIVSVEDSIVVLSLVGKDSVFGSGVILYALVPVEVITLNIKYHADFRGKINRSFHLKARNLQHQQVRFG